MTGCHLDCLSKNTKNPIWIYLLKISVYGQYTVVFFRHEDSPGGAVTNLLGAQIDFVAFKQKIVIMPDWPFFGCILYNVFGEGS